MLVSERNKFGLPRDISRYFTKTAAYQGFRCFDERKNQLWNSTADRGGFRRTKHLSNSFLIGVICLNLRLKLFYGCCKSFAWLLNSKFHHSGAQCARVDP